MQGRFETALPEEQKPLLLSIGLLGPPEACVRGRPLRIRIKKALALLCYLAAKGGRRHRRRELAGLLWPESDQRRTRADLRVVLSKLRKCLGEEGAYDEEEVARFFFIEADLLGPPIMVAVHSLYQMI